MKYINWNFIQLGGVMDDKGLDQWYAEKAHLYDS